MPLIMNNQIQRSTSQRYFRKNWHRIKRDRYLLLLLLPLITYLIVFKLLPILGNIAAFENFKVARGFFGSQWVGFKNFRIFLSSPDFLLILRNTLILGLYGVLTYPLAIVFALLLNEIKSLRLKKTIQTISYMPFFISIVVLCGMAWNFLSPDGGVVNNILTSFGFKPQFFMAKSEWFRFIFTFLGNWQNLGYNSIIFIAAISTVSVELYDAAEIDGCNRMQKIMHVTLPGISSTIAVMTILVTGGMILIAYERALLLQSPATYVVSDVIGTYVYRRGIKEINYSLATAVGLFESVVSLVLISTANFISNKLSDSGIW